jgi:hypothetical protein
MYGRWKSPLRRLSLLGSWRVDVGSTAQAQAGGLLSAKPGS